MVKICPDNYPLEQEAKYKQYFEKYPYELSTFQKYGIESVIEGHHVLVTAHTGSGKTLSAEFAIEHLVAKGKKVIYTAPIKALSNQKFHEFTHKYPHISFGILTGDIKTNPEADVLIMTTEILLNTLYNKLNGAEPSLIAFDMDIENELGCVVFDEVHYVNDPDRGRVWEESIMMLPLHIQMVMLSATIDRPEKFASWCETRGSTNIQQNNSSNKIVYLSSTNHRVVPLTHYSFITTNNNIYKTIKDKVLEKEIRDTTNKLFVIQSSQGTFNEPHYHKIRKILNTFQEKRTHISRAHVINQVCSHMVDHNMLPALCFVLSRKQLEICAKEVTTGLLEVDSKVGYTIHKECEQIIRKLPNYEEYLHLPEYVEMVALLEKGIAIHHSGVMPVLKEMVEILYAKGYVKLLFATETFSIGVNMPTKTVLFTSSTKFDGNYMRNLYSHEYTQMAGRAGRRGIDKVGNVIHLNNLFKDIDCTSYKQMMQGKPQTLSSKFKITYNLLLNLIYMGDANFSQYARRSMIQEDIDAELGVLRDTIFQKTLANPNQDIILRTPRESVDEYISVTNNVKTLTNKKRREANHRITSLKDDYKFIESDKKILEGYYEKQTQLTDLKTQCHNLEQFLDNNVSKVLDILIQHNFVESIENIFSLTSKGKIATHIRETHCLIFAQLLHDERLFTLSARQLVGLFSCFTNISVSDDYKNITPKSDDQLTNHIALEVQTMYNDFLNMEGDKQIDTGTDYYMHFDMIETTMKWCDCENITDCKLLLQETETNKGIFLGEFIKSLLKINNISNEMEKIAEANGHIAFLNTLREIPILTLKYVATNQSLYV